MDSTADSTTGAATGEAAVPDDDRDGSATRDSGASDDEATGSGASGDRARDSGTPGDSAPGGGASGDEASRGGRSEPAVSNKQKLLDQEGDAAADYLEELLDIADLDGDIDIFVENGRASVAILADEADPGSLSSLIGRDGEVLDALQELTRLAAQSRTGERSRLLLDIAGWREDRRSTAALIASEAVERVRSGGESIELEPMPAYQRKAVHDAVAEAGLRSESAGAEPNRYVVIHPA